MSPQAEKAQAELHKLRLHRDLLRAELNRITHRISRRARTLKRLLEKENEDAENPRGH